MCRYFSIGLIDFMFAGKTLTDFTNLFSPNNFKRNGFITNEIFYNKCLKMTECNSVECNSYEAHNIYPNLGVSLSDQQQFKLNKINESKDYFVAEIKERELMCIKMMNSHRSDAEKTNLIEEGKKLGINEIIKLNKIINNSLKQ